MNVNLGSYTITGTPAEMAELIGLLEKPAPTPAPALKSKQAEVPHKPRKEFDMGKLKSLRTAGWTVAKIADDMGVSEPTVSKYLKILKEQEGTA